MRTMISRSLPLLAVVLAVSACDDGDGPIDKAWDCRQLCAEAQQCVGGDDFDASECREECREDADDDAVDDCENCLDDQDSCASDAKCAAECGGVLASTVFQ